MNNDRLLEATAQWAVLLAVIALGVMVIVRLGFWMFNIPL